MLAFIAVVVALPKIVHVDLSLLNFVAAAVVPLLTGLVTKRVSPLWFKSIILTALSAAGGAISAAISNNGNLILESTLYSIALTIGLGFAAHYAYTISGLQQLIERLTGNFGVGPYASVAGGRAAYRMEGL